MITLGELGHKRWKRLDYVAPRYNIQALEDLTVTHLIDKIQNIANCNKKSVKIYKVLEYKNIARVYLTVHDLKITSQWEKNKNWPTTQRDRAMIELLLSSGIRVGELVNLDIKNIDFINNEFTVIGKGNKERLCFFNDITGLHLQTYLSERTDDNPALFVTLNSPYLRMGLTGIEGRIRQIGESIGITLYPHKFRHTFATNALNKGIPIEQVQTLLGHKNLDTTLIYAKVAMDDVKHNHKKLMR